MKGGLIPWRDENVFFISVPQFIVQGLAQNSTVILVNESVEVLMNVLSY